MYHANEYSRYSASLAFNAIFRMLRDAGINSANIIIYPRCYNSERVSLTILVFTISSFARKHRG